MPLASGTAASSTAIRLGSGRVAEKHLAMRGVHFKCVHRLGRCQEWSMNAKPQQASCCLGLQAQLLQRLERYITNNKYIDEARQKNAPGNQI